MRNNVTIITPCFNENVTVIAFLHEVVEVVKDLPFQFTIVVVDDASTDNTLKLLQEFEPAAQNVTMQILKLRYNSGHQGAIYQGLLFARELDCNKFIVMDSDGEDDPQAIRELVYVDDYKIVNVIRGRRKENFTFRFSYHIYKIIFNLITGRIMNFGNYCMIDKDILQSATGTSFVHFAAYLSKHRVEAKKIIYNRRKRIDGKSKMNLTSLVHHAFKSFIEYAEDFLMIFLKLFLFIAIVFIGMIGYVLYKKIFTDEAILGWASTLSASLFTTAIICLGFFVIGILLLNILSKNKSANHEIFINMSAGRNKKQNSDNMLEEV
ncbi:glycosyltransferase [Cesiribacter sp. SM1]|uniref:glycosyltransferase n=1 Tax=Cesiribacter sp. SM1 TaxID=2861196 RepID=UPI001CD2F2AF|nr:glycosyltransferase [Cesiribacter sp. SM1]